MKISLIMVITADGKIARHSDEHTFTWNSKEDRKHFLELSKKIGTVIVGSTTFDTVGKKSLEDRYTYVMTRNPDKYEAVETVEYISGTATDVLEKLKTDGVEEVALIGGATINAIFLASGLVTDLYLTIEPKLFGRGLSIAEGVDLDIDLQLLSIEKMNDKGTLLAHYEVINDSK